MGWVRRFRHTFGLVFDEEPDYEAPDPVMLANGDILVPVGDPTTGYKMERIEVGADHHAERLRQIQERERRANRGGGFIGGGFISGDD